MAGLVDASADMIDVGGYPADSSGQLFLLGVVHLDDVTINGHLTEIRSHVVGAQLRHFTFNEPVFIVADAELNAYRSCSICHGAPPYGMTLMSYLEQYKFKNWTVHQNGSAVTQEERKARAKAIAGQLCNHQLWLSHSNRISRTMAWDTCKLKITHPEDTEGLNRALKRFWALMCFFMENAPVVKIFASENYMLFRNEVTKSSR